MKTQLNTYALLISICMVSCQKNADLLPKIIPAQSNQISHTNKPLPTAIYINDVMTKSFSYDRTHRLILVNEADGTTKKFIYGKNNLLEYMDIIKENRNERIRFMYESSLKKPLEATRFLVTQTIINRKSQVGDVELPMVTEYEQPISKIVIKYNESGAKISEKETALISTGNSFEATYNYDGAGQLTGIVKTQLEAIQEEMSVMEFATGQNALEALSVLAYEPGVAVQTGNPKVLFKAGIKLFGHENNEYKLNIFGQPIQITTRFDDDRTSITKIVY